MFEKLRRENGFTFIELLIVIAIIGILSYIAILQFYSYRQNVNNAAALSDIRSFKTAAESYFTDHLMYP